MGATHAVLAPPALVLARHLGAPMPPTRAGADAAVDAFLSLGLPAAREVLAHLAE